MPVLKYVCCHSVYRVSLLDYVENDDDTHFPLPEDYNADQVTKTRLTCDYTTNRLDRTLINMCIANELRILNVRFLGDSTGHHIFY